MAGTRIRETDLYQPVKTLLESQGYEVKGEVASADIVAVRGEEEPVIVELKTGFTLALFHQAVERMKLSDCVYIAAPRGKGRAFLKALAANKLLCRRLGLGLITVRLEDGLSEIHLDPTPYQPRQSKAKRERLLREFQRRVGDPNTGGSTGVTIMTAYRQDAIRLLHHLGENGPCKASDAAKATGVEKARNIMADDHYGWFERVERGIYGVTPKGIDAIALYSEANQS